MGFVLGSVDRDLGQIEPDETVVAREGLVDQAVEHAGLPPLVAPSTQGGF